MVCVRLSAVRSSVFIFEFVTVAVFEFFVFCLFCLFCLGFLVLFSRSDHCHGLTALFVWMQCTARATMAWFESRSVCLVLPAIRPCQMPRVRISLCLHRLRFCHCPKSPSHDFINTNVILENVPPVRHVYSVVPPPPATLISTAALIGAAAGLAAIVVALNVWYFKYRKVCFFAHLHFSCKTPYEQNQRQNQNMHSYHTR